MPIRQQKQISRLQISMAEANALHVRQCAHERHEHLFHFFLSPEEAHLLSFAEDVFEVLLVLDVFTNNANSERIVHRLIEKVTVKLDYILVILRLKQLYSLLFVLIELIQRLGFDLFQGVKLSCLSVNYFIDFCVLLSRAQQINLFEIFFSKHLLIYLILILGI